MQWLLRDPVRFLHEQAELEKLSTEPWLKALAWRLGGEFAVEVDMDMEIHGSLYAMTLTYPELFPETPAYIRPRDSAEHWSGHQYGPGGSLCLEYRADNWDPQVTGADLLRSAHKLLVTERHPDKPSQVASAHRQTQGQRLQASGYRLVCTAELSVKLSSLPAVGMFRLSVKEAFHETAMVVFVSELESVNGEGSMEGVPDVPAGITSFGPFFALSGRGRVLKSKEFDEPGSISTVDELLALASRAGFDREKILEGFSETIGDSIVLLVGSTLKGMRAFGIAKGDAPALRRYSVIRPEKHADRLPAEHAGLKQSRVGIVGLGSIGSKVALSLARSGVRRFLLVDDDLLLPENICRNELSWAGVGIHKAEAVREALSLVAPDLGIGVRIHRVAGQESAVAAAAALKDLAACDLLVDATANAEVFLRLAAVARMAKRPLCWGEVFAGGLGGLIAMARPGIDPNPVAVRNAILSYLETQPPAPYRQAVGYDVEGHVPVIATDSDVTLIAGSLSRFALDTLLRAKESQYPYSAYLLGFRNEWIFSQPFDTQPITVNGPGWDDGPSASDEERLNAVKLLLKLAAERHDDHTDSATPSG
jgi:hypothetical protein